MCFEGWARDCDYENYGGTERRNRLQKLLNKKKKGGEEKGKEIK